MRSLSRQANGTQVQLSMFSTHAGVGPWDSNETGKSTGGKVLRGESQGAGVG